MLLPLADFGFRLVSLKIWTYFIMLIVRYLIVFLNHDYATSGVDVIMMEGQHGLFLSKGKGCIIHGCCDFSIIHWIAILTSAETSPIQNVSILNWERDSWKGWKS